MQIGLFGGTFNPIHNGHLSVAKEVKDGFSLDKIILFPSAIPPHKESENVASADDRLKMLHIAISDDPSLSKSFAVSDVELKRSGPSYTIDTVNYYQSSMTDSEQLYLIMGIDAFFEIDTWKSYLDLFQTISFIVISRPEENSKPMKASWEALGNIIQTKISSQYEYSSSQNCYHHPHKMNIYTYNVTPVDISATKIRKLIKNGMPIRSMVPPGVEEYIKSKGLYT